MIPFLTYPLALLALAALPALAAIYLLRNRFKRKPVSTLFLWQFQQESKAGGSKVEKLRLPPVFFLELLVLLLLGIAATGPRWQLAQTTHPLVVVLDDSLSMLAISDAKEARDRATAALEQLLRDRKFLFIRFVLAGRDARALGGSVHSWAEAAPLLAGWKCQAPAADLAAAIALAGDLTSRKADILVLTDQARPAELELASRMQWWAFGTAAPNLAIVNATRTAQGPQDRCLLEVANYSRETRTARLQLTAGTNISQHSSLTLEPGARQRIILNLPPNTPALEAALPDDALLGDNRVTLLPAPRKRIRVQVALDNPELRDLFTRGLESTGLRSSITADPELVIHQSRAVPAGERAWGLRILSATNATAYTGPFVVNAAHPLTRGLELQGLIWAAVADTNLATQPPVITAGDVPLLTAREDALGRQQITLQFTPALTTLPATPNWPIFLWNLLSWRARETPGLEENNFRLGSDIILKTTNGPVRLVRPDHTAQDFAKTQRLLLLEATAHGLYTAIHGHETNTFSVNFLAAEESDLTATQTGRWGEWQTQQETRYEYAAVLWLFLLAALCSLAAHLVILARGQREAGI